MRRYKHNLSHYHLFTCDMGELIPAGIVEVLPGDTIQQSTNVVVRMSPMAAPVMHPVTVRVHHFFVPHRLNMPTWENFITGGPDGDDASTIPTLAASDAQPLFDYLGANMDGAVHALNVLPVRAFNAVFNEYYRDQDLVPERAEDAFTIPKIAWEKDYFTSARPWPQKGTAVTLPLGTSAPVVGTGDPSFTYTGGPGSLQAVATGNNVGLSNVTSNGSMGWSDPNLEADLANAVGADINDVRRAFAIQRYQEARARYGSRYSEYLRYLGVTPSDGRLEKPEFLGGGQAQVNFSEVLQTSPSEGQGTDFGVGDLYGHGIGALRSNKYRRFIEEHGYIITMFSVRPKAMYANGIPRHFMRTDKEDFYTPELAHIGQQEVLDRELHADQQNDVFGYQDRYSEYRFERSRVSGEFRDTLDYWHLGRKWPTPPTLNQSFVECDPSKRIFNEQTQHGCWVMAQHKIVARRMVSRDSSSRIF